VETLAARNAALEAEMRELREQFRATRAREEIAARIREEMDVRPRRCADCGYGYTAGACRCGVPRSAMRPGWDSGRRYSRETDFEARSPRPRRASVRWVDEVDWD
jgi:hypothetical protein